MSEGAGTPAGTERLPEPEPLEELEVRLGHRFRDIELLRRALTHRSYANELEEEVPDNEVLEFLGDAVLGLVVSDLLYRRHPALTEGEMSKIKSFLVSAESLSRCADALDLGDYLLLGRGAEKTAGRAKESLLANSFEAVIASLYLDAGLERARAFIDRFLGEELRSAAEADTALRDFKSALQEHLQAESLPLPVYQVVEERGPDHDKVFRVEVWVGEEILADGEGKTKKSAEQSAAREALEVIIRRGD